MPSYRNLNTDFTLNKIFALDETLFFIFAHLHFTGRQGKEDEFHSSLLHSPTSVIHFDISWVITAETSTVHIDSTGLETATLHLT